MHNTMNRDYKQIIHPILSLLTPYIFLMAFTHILQDIITEYTLINIFQYIIILTAGIVKIMLNNLFLKERVSRLNIFREFIITGVILYLAFSLVRGGPFMVSFNPHLSNIYPLVICLIFWGACYRHHVLFRRREFFLDRIHNKNGLALKKEIKKNAVLSSQTFHDMKEYNNLFYLPGVLLFVSAALARLSEIDISPGAIILTGLFFFCAFLSSMTGRLFIDEYKHMAEGINFSRKIQRQRIFLGIFFLAFTLLIASQTASPESLLKLPGINFPSREIKKLPGPNPGNTDFMDYSYRYLEPLKREKVEPFWLFKILNRILLSAAIIAVLVFITRPFFSKNFKRYLKGKRLSRFLLGKLKYIIDQLAAIGRDFLLFLKSLGPGKQKSGDSKETPDIPAREKREAQRLAFQKRREIGKTLKLFLKLTNWGKYQGIRYHRDLTAREYIKKLIDRFPAHSPSLDFITAAFEEARYSPHTLGVKKSLQFTKEVKRVIRRRK